jgi:D-alanyl-D-alanine endopeptidase (penicillin-binding protein 7)
MPARSLDEPIRITKDDRDLPKCNTSRLSVGTVLTRGDLMHLALMSSENHAAHALGANYPGGMTAMVSAMNAKAAALGMTNTHFVDPTGLSSQNVASPEDLSKLVIAAAQNPTIREFSTDPHYSVRVQRHLVEFRNTDNLVANPTWNIVVQKTGYIAEAGKCLVMEAVIEGPIGRHRTARFLGQVHARCGCQAHQELDGIERRRACPGVDALIRPDALFGEVSLDQRPPDFRTPRAEEQVMSVAVIGDPVVRKPSGLPPW